MKKLAITATLATALALPIAADVITSDSADNAYQKTTVKWFSETITLAVTDTNAVTSGYVQLLEGAFPAGHIVVHGCVVKDAVFTPAATPTNGVTGADAGDFALGSTAAAGTDLTTTEVDFAPKTALATLTNITDAVLADDAIIDGSSTTADLYLNLLLDADAALFIATNTVTCSGEASILWSFIGND